MGSNMEKCLMDWLLEKNDIGVKYLAMRDLFKTDTEELLAVKKLAHQEGPIAVVLSKMHKASEPNYLALMAMLPIDYGVILTNRS